MKDLQEPPEGIIITLSQAMFKKNGYRGWLKNFLFAMENHEKEFTYWMRLGAAPKREILYVYLCIGNKIRFRAYFAGNRPAGEQTFGSWAGGSGATMYARAWILLSGPVERAPHKIEMKGFRGFRYTHKLW